MMLQRKPRLALEDFKESLQINSGQIQTRKKRVAILYRIDPQKAKQEQKKLDEILLFCDMYADVFQRK